MVTSIETQTILACSADLADWDAYRVTRTLNEHFKELGLGAETRRRCRRRTPAAASTIRSTTELPGTTAGATSESFPYQVLVVAIGASVAMIAYWNTLALSGVPTASPAGSTASSRFTMTTPSESPAKLGAVKVRAVLRYKEGRLNKEGYERVNEYVDMFHKVMEDRVSGLISPATRAIDTAGRAHPSPRARGRRPRPRRWTSASLFTRDVRSRRVSLNTEDP